MASETYDERVGAILADWLEFAQGKVAPDLEAFLSRYPDDRESLKRSLQDWLQMWQLTAPLRKLAADQSGNQSTPTTGPTWARAVQDSSSTTVVPSSNNAFTDYELLAELGRGGMGIVYKARQRSLNRLVALKVVRSGDIGTSVEIERFHKEAALVAQLDHPRIVPIYEVGAQHDRPFFSMKLIEGGGLHEHLPKYQADPRAAAGLLAVVARAVHHAHQRGILHRDLKPSNILLDSEGRPHITDFGLAKQLEDDGSLTQTGALLGTPSYMAPEQTRGRRSSITTAADVYGLGAILYTLLTGQPPFRAGTVMETLAQVQHQEPALPSSVQGRTDRDLQTICLKCLHKDPSKRYSSAEALAEDLERWLSGASILARPARARERVWKWIRRRPTAAALIGVSSVALLFMVAGLFMYNRHVSAALDVSDQLRTEGLQREARLLRHLHVADLRAARQHWENGDDGRAVELLDRYLPAAGAEDLRGFAWHQLRSASSYKPKILGRHEAPVLCLAVSPDDRWLATGDKQGIVKIWDLTAGKEHRVLTVPGQEICAVRFSPDSRVLATAGMELSIRLWDVATWTEKGQLQGFVNTVRSVAFSTDGTLLAAGLVDNTVRIWNLTQQGTPGKIWKSHRDDVQCVDWSPDGKQLLSASNDRSVKIWDLATEQPSSEFRDAHASTVLTAAFSPRQPLIATGSYDNWIRLWDVGNRTEWTAYDMGNTVRGIAFSREGYLLAGVGGDGAIAILELPNRWRGHRLRRYFRDGDSRLRAVGFVHHDRIVITAGESGLIKLWDVAGFCGVKSASLPFSDVTLSGDGRYAVGTAPDGALHLVESATAKTIGSLTGPEGSTATAAFSSCGRWIAIAGKDQHITIWDLATRQPRTRWRPAQGAIAGLAFRPDGDILATGDKDGSIRLWDVRTGALSATYHQGDGKEISPRLFLRFAPDGQTLFTIHAENSKEIVAWDVPRGERRTALRPAAVDVSSFAVSPDGRYLAAGVARRLIQVWDLQSDQEPITLAGHMHSVLGLAFSPDGQTLASTSQDGTVRLWHLPTSQVLYTLHGCRLTPGAVAFSQDGRTLTVAAGSTGESELLTWHTPDHGAERNCNFKGRNDLE